MKVLIIFLSLVFVAGCVTAKKRDLSSPKTESLKSEPVSNTSRKLAGFGTCVEACLDERLPNFGCRADCKAKFSTAINRKICINRCKTEDFKQIEKSCLRDCS